MHSACLDSHQSHRPAPQRRLRRLIAAVALVAAAGVAGPAAAAPDAAEIERAEGLATEAKAYFKGKLYEQAATKFLQAFGVARRPALVFNAARAYEEAKKPRRAVAIFQMYADLPDCSAEGKADALQRIKVLRAGIAASEAAAAKDADLDKRAGGGAGAASGKSKQGAGEATVARSAPAGRVFPLWRTVAGGGLTLLAAGAWLNALSLATQMPFEEVVDDASKTRYLELADDARMWQVIAITGAVVGVGVLAWGQVDYWLLQRPVTARRGAISLLPVPQSRGMGFALHVAF